MAVQTDERTVSVVVACCEGPAALNRLLGELTAQRSPTVRQVIVVDGTGAVTARDVAGIADLEVQLLSAAGEDVAVLRAIGARAARGHLVAFLEDHCRLPSDWCATLLRTWAAGHRGFGGAIENGSFRAPPDWAAYLLEFGAFMPPLPAGVTDRLPGMNVAYERALIEGLGEPALCEPIVNGRLREQGIALHAEPELIVVFERRFGVRPFLEHLVSGARIFGASRPRRRLRLLQGVHAAAIVTLLPLMMVARIGARVFARRRARIAFILALPWLLVYSVAWSLGEAAGELRPSTGSGGAERSESLPPKSLSQRMGEPR